MAKKQSRVPLVLHEEDEIDLDLWEVVNHSDGEFSEDSFAVDSISDDDVISLDEASSSLISPPRQILSETDEDGDEIAADLDLVVHVDGDDMFLDGDSRRNLAADLDLDGHFDSDGDCDGDDVSRGNVSVDLDLDSRIYSDGDCDGDDAFINGVSRRSLAVDPDPDVGDVFVDGDLNDHIDTDGDGDGDEDDVFLDGGSDCSDEYVNDEEEEDEDGDDDYEEEEEDAYDDLYEELVLENVRRKVGRQRMRKIGNRAISKVKTCRLKPSKIALCKQFRCY
ncbi:unnamed protein product [Cochlearia groenlandica]